MLARDPDFKYLIDDLMRILGVKEMSTYEIAQEAHMAMMEVWDWLVDMENAGMVKRRYYEGRWHWKRVK